MKPALSWWNPKIADHRKGSYQAQFCVLHPQELQIVQKCPLQLLVYQPKLAH